MDAIATIRTRRSVRDYLPRAVPRDIIAAIIGDACCAPFTPVSLPEPWVFMVIEGVERIAAYGARALEFARLNRPQVHGYEWTDNPNFSVFYNAPAVVVISARSDNSQALGECTRAAQNFSLSAHARGLGSCWVGSPVLWMRDPVVMAELAIQDGHMPFAVLTLGYPASVPPSPPPFVPRIAWADQAQE